MSEGTREQLIAVATSRFSEKGFYGTSIAGIAEELGLTKQALLHHFGSKEKLYAEVMHRLSDMLIATIDESDDGRPPARRIEHTLDAIRVRFRSHPEEARLVLRELLDNRQRAETAGVWPLKPFLDRIAELTRAALPEERLDPPAALAIAYQFLGAIGQFAVSEPTLRAMYGAAQFAAMEQRFDAELVRLARLRLGGE